MISATNYHLPSGLREALAAYHEGNAELDSALRHDAQQIEVALGQLAVITDPNSQIQVGVEVIGSHRLLAIDGHSRAPDELTVDR